MDDVDRCRVLGIVGQKRSKFGDLDIDLPPMLPERFNRLFDSFDFWKLHPSLCFPIPIRAKAREILFEFVDSLLLLSEDFVFLRGRVGQ